MNETDIEPSVDNSTVVANEESRKILFNVESSSKGDVVRFYSKQDESITTDIVFEVESTDGETVYFHAHRSVLQPFKVLSELFDCQQDVDAIPLSNVDPKVFHCLLINAYGGVVSDEDFKSYSKDIIETADQFGYDELKVKGEEQFLKLYPISMENVVDKLSYADAKNCETMLSSVMGFLILNGIEAVEKLSFDEIPGHLMKNLLVATNSVVLSNKKQLDQLQEQNELIIKQNLETRAMAELANVLITENEEVVRSQNTQLQSRIDQLEERMESIPLQEQLDELEEQLEEEEQRANRLEKQLEKDRQRVRYLEEERKRVWTWYRRAKDESKEVNHDSIP